MSLAITLGRKKIQQVKNETPVLITQLEEGFNLYSNNLDNISKNTLSTFHDQCNLMHLDT